MTQSGYAHAGKAAASARFPRVAMFSWIITCSVIAAIFFAGCSSQAGGISRSRKMGESRIDAGRKAGYESAPRSSREARAAESPAPCCKRAREFLESAYVPLVHRFGKKYGVLETWLQDLIYTYPSQLWMRVKYRRLKPRTGAPSTRFNGIEITFPGNQKAKLIGRWLDSNHRYVSESFRITAGKSGKVLDMKFFTAGPPFKNMSGSELTHSPAHGTFLTPTGPPLRPMPDLLRSLRYSNTTPFDLYPLIGEQNVKPTQWQLRRLRHIWHRIETKFFAMRAARDCLFNGHLFAMAGSCRLINRDLGLASLYLPEGPYIGELIFKFPAGYRHREEIREEEAIFRGVRLIPSAVGPGSHPSSAK